MPHKLTPEEIRAARAADPKPRARDFAESHDLTEAELVAAHTGAGVTRIDPDPDRLVPLVGKLGDVMALTRNQSCVHERRGVYDDYHGGPHAAMVLGSEIDLRIFPAQWVYAFAVEQTAAVQQAGAEGVSRSIQVFDAHGDAVHKVHLKPESDAAAFAELVDALRMEDQSEALTLTPRPSTEAARSDPARADALRAEWGRMTDTHQFLKLTRKLKMNRLGAYRVAGAPHAVPLDPSAVTAALTHAAADSIPVMIFVGNPGCIQIHGGLIEKIVPMGPWFNVMDPRFNLHLRADHIAEVWLVNKPTQRGDAVSVEAFDRAGGLILQVFGYRKDAPPDAWNAMVQTLPLLVAEVVA